jgi:predicted DNA-binding WGR domain protein
MTGPGLQNGRRTTTAPLPTLTSEMTEQLAAFRAYIRFASVDLDQNRWRFYDLRWQPTLFGEGALVRVWGRQSQSSTRRVTVSPDRADAHTEVRQVVRRRLRHGYQVTDWQ